MFFLPNHLSGGGELSGTRRGEGGGGGAAAHLVSPADALSRGRGTSGPAPRPGQPPPCTDAAALKGSGLGRPPLGMRSRCGGAAFLRGLASGATLWPWADGLARRGCWLGFRRGHQDPTLDSVRSTRDPGT